jgi:hypothetical protein
MDMVSVFAPRIERMELRPTFETPESRLFRDKRLWPMPPAGEQTLLVNTGLPIPDWLKPLQQSQGRVPTGVLRNGIFLSAFAIA